MQIIQDKALLVSAGDPTAITSRVTKSVDTEFGVLVKWGQKEVEQLTELGFHDAPSPILKKYKWTGKLTPFDHQKETAAFLAANKRAFCFNEQGTGKTASVIWAADYLMKQGRVKRVLVICPLSIMKASWQQDIFKFAMHRSCGIAHGSAAQRAKVINAGAEFVIINFDGVATAKNEILNGGFDLIVVDECFVAGTQVHTPDGPKAIETLNAGDMVFTSNGVAPIKTVKRRESADIVEVTLRNGERITCTGEHPFFTDVGWVIARNLNGRRLVSQSDMSCMRAQLPSPEAPMGLASEVGHQQVPLLLEILRTEEVAPSQSGEVILRGYASGEEGEIYGVYEVTGDAATHILEAEGHRAQASDTGRQRSWDDSCGAPCTPAPTFGVGMELPSSVGEAAVRLSHKLQARLCGPHEETGAGSGWWKPYFRFAESAGHEEGGQAGGAWVESVSRVECGSGVAVYNLEVEGTPNYFVGGGWLVHNCNAYKNAQTYRWKTLFGIVTTTKPRLWMLTGTPAAQSPLDAYGLAKLVGAQNCPRFFGAYRDMVMLKVTKFKWAPKPHAQDIVHSMLQPAIRFEKKDCLDLPPVVHVQRDVPLTPQQRKYYNNLKNQLLIEAAGEQVSAVNAATKIGKLLQISCLAGDTEVLTRGGWKYITAVTPYDEVWDGEEWVRCSGMMPMGRKRTIQVEGIRMTLDHKILTASGWATAEDYARGYASGKLARYEVRIPDGYSSGGDVRVREMRSLGMRMRLRADSGSEVTEPTHTAPPQRAPLRLPARRTHKDPRYGQQSPVPYMVAYAKALLRPFAQGLSQLRGPRDNRLPGMEGLVLGILGGHGGRLRSYVNFGSRGQQRSVLPGKLPLGDCAGPIEQHAEQRFFGYTQGAYDHSASGNGLRGTEGDPTRPYTTVRMVDGESPNRSVPEEVYDLVNCGPRSRFTVRGKDGQILIVHNCGAVYSDDGQVLEFDVSNRINEIIEVIEETQNKVLVFVPFTHTIALIKDKLAKEGITCDVINGSVPVNRRSDIVQRFQTNPEPKVLLIQPQAASHGLTLTAADTIIWYAPVTSVETYLQANARIDRPGQKNNMTIVHIAGSEVEHRLYGMLRSNIQNHQKIVDLYKEELDIV
jgi:hypothetical protein